MEAQSLAFEQLRRYYSISREFNMAYEEWARAHGISSTSLMVLDSICENQDNCTQKEISRQWLICKQTVNMVLKDMEQKGLVELIPLEADRRSKRIRLTAAGREYAESIVRKVKKAELSVIEKMGYERMELLNESLSLFVHLFRETGDAEKNE